MLAGLLKAPSRYNPVNNFRLAKKRTLQVLSNMRDTGILSKFDRKDLNKGLAGVSPENPSKKSRYFTDWILSQVSSYVSPGNADIIVTTTLDTNMQLVGETVISKALKSGAGLNLSQAALIAMTPTGAVRTLSLIHISEPTRPY